MSTASSEQVSSENGLSKVLTGIQGLDEITEGGLPQGRPTLVCGSAGCGKTLLSMEFLVRGTMEYNEPGVFMAFEETAEELAKNVRSLGFDLDRLVVDQKLRLDYVRVERSEIEETGEYDLEGLFVRLGYAIDSIGAKRVVLDTIESLFSAFTDGSILRAELRRLFRWLKDKGVTAIITGERGKEGNLTRQGIEEYVSDCVILLDHRVNEQISTRRLRVVKYRGTTHGTNEYPFIIDKLGISVLPVTSLGLKHKVSRERVSTGIERLDAMLAGQGVYRGSTVLVTGTAGTGKSSLAAPLRRCGLPPRREVSVLRLRGIARPDRAQYGIHRTASPAACRKRSAAVRGVQADGPRVGVAPGHYPSSRRGLPPGQRGPRPGDQPRAGWHAIGSTRHASAVDRLPEVAERPPG